MQPEASFSRRVLIRLKAAITQLRLEIKIVTGGRASVLLIVTALWFGVFALIARVRDEPWSSDVFFNLMLVIPGSLLAVSLSMVSVIGDRDSGQLETTFVSPTGRHGAWAHRFAAVILSWWLAVGALSLLTWLFVDPGHRPLVAWLHAFPPLFFITALTLCCSLLFKSSSVAGLCVGIYLGVFGVFGDIWPPGSVWFNPVALPTGQEDLQAFFRSVVFNRSGLLLAGTLAMVLTFGLLQRRERLL